MLEVLDQLWPDSERGTLGLHGAGAPDVQGRCGVSSGSGILETLGAVGPSLVLCGIVVTTVPVAAG